MQSLISPPRVSFDITQGDVAGLPDRRLQSLAQYWFARRNPDGLVPRAAIDPLDFPALLPNIMLLDRIGLPPDERYRFRLAGTEAVNFAGRELTGKHIDELLPDTYHDYVRLLNRTALEKRLPVYTFSLYHDQGNFVNGVTYRLVLPIASQGASQSVTPVTGPDMILACQFWQRRQQEDGFWTGDWQSVQPEIRLIAADPA